MSTDLQNPSNNNNIRLLKIDKPQLNTEMLKVKVIYTQYKHKTKEKTPSVTVSKQQLTVLW